MPVGQDFHFLSCTFSRPWVLSYHKSLLRNARVKTKGNMQMGCTPGCAGGADWRPWVALEALIWPLRAAVLSKSKCAALSLLCL